tara:strand:- start:45583 stop:45999 length:417 start_codon:yes stop_codon:yes gene_type:complete
MWQYNNKEVNKLPEDCEAFVYLITNNDNGMKYVGKKLAKFKTTKPPLKGKKNKRRGTKESDWRTYWGSNDHLKEDVIVLGEDKFTREILYFCTSRGIASYLEAKEQFDREVLLTDDYYNGIINVRVGGSKILKEALSD